MSFRKVRRFLELRNNDRLLFAEAVIMLLFSKVLIVFVPLRKVAPYFGTLNPQASGSVSFDKKQKAVYISDFIQKAGRNVFWRSVCLDQALATMIMLNRRKITNSLCLGVLKDESTKRLKAHAWITCEKEIIIGGEQSNQYVIVATFSKHI